MSRQILIGLAQLAPQPRDIDSNLACMQRVLEDHPAVDWVVFPELWLGGYTASDVADLAIAVEDARLAPLSATAKRLATAVIFGAAVVAPFGIANAAVVIDARGRWADCYAKTYLFGDEPDVYAAGNELVVADIGGVKTGLMICFDVEFPEVARALAAAGAEVLVTISANMTPFGNDHRIFGLARAIENGCPHIYVNLVGTGERFVFTGNSMVVSPDGELLADAGAKSETVATARITVGARSTVRPNYLDYVPARPLPVRAALF